MIPNEEQLIRNRIESILNRSFDRIVQELFPMGTRNAAMRRKTDAVKIIMEELERTTE